MTPSAPGLGEYLRRRRSLIAAPDTSGSGRDSHRRVPGLRRQELAEIASISVEYYTRLEQGRAPRPSRDVLAALSRAFDLADAERDHLFRLAGELPPELPEPSRVVRPGLMRMMAHLDTVMPLTVHDGRLDVVAVNDAAAQMFGSVVGDGHFGRNIVYSAFTTRVFADRLDEDGATQLLRVGAAELRMALSRYPNDSYLTEMLIDLSARSPLFQEHWERGEVGAWRSAFKRIRHARLGWVDCETEMLHDPERDHWMMLYALQEHQPDDQVSSCRGMLE